MAISKYSYLEKKRIVRQIDKDLEKYDTEEACKKNGITDGTYRAWIKEIEIQMEKNKKHNSGRPSRKKKNKKEKKTGFCLHFNDYDLDIDNFSNIHFEDAMITIKDDKVFFEGKGYIED